MTSYGSQFSADTIDTEDLHSSGTIFWQNFSPALGGDGGIPTLSAVLEAGDDANEQPLLNVGKITLNKNASDPTIDATISNCSGLDFGSQTGSTITGSTAANDKTICSNLDLRDASNLFPSSIDDDDIEDVLNRGSDANQENLSNVNSFSATTVNVLATGSLLAAGASAAQLPETTMFGNLNLEDTSNVKHSITNVNAISTESLSATGTTGFAGQIGATRQITAPIFQISAPYTGQPVNSGIEFNSGITDPTEIRGVSVANRTKLLNCDLSSSTNLQAAPTEERYEWGSVWTNAKTIFPAPPYDDGSTTQIPTIDLVRFDFNTIDLTRTPQWRYFAPQSDSDRQIDPDDHMGLHEGEYIGNRGGPNSTAWPFAFYATTASTTVEEHASQVVEFHFPATFYGYGRIYMCLAAHGPPYTSEPVIYQQTFRLVMEHEGSALATNPRLNGPIQMKWYCKNMFPTDGTQWRVYPMCRVDDARHYGRLQINIGDGQPLDGNNPGVPPDFTPANTNAQNGQLLLRGYPLPAQWMEMENVDPSV